MTTPALPLAERIATALAHLGTLAHAPADIRECVRRRDAGRLGEVLHFHQDNAAAVQRHLPAVELAAVYGLAELPAVTLAAMGTPVGLYGSTEGERLVTLHFRGAAQLNVLVRLRRARLRYWEFFGAENCHAAATAFTSDYERGIDHQQADRPVTLGEIIGLGDGLSPLLDEWEEVAGRTYGAAWREANLLRSEAEKELTDVVPEVTPRKSLNKLSELRRDIHAVLNRATRPFSAEVIMERVNALRKRRASKIGRSYRATSVASVIGATQELMENEYVEHGPRGYFAVRKRKRRVGSESVAA